MLLIWGNERKTRFRLSLIRLDQIFNVEAAQFDTQLPLIEPINSSRFPALLPIRTTKLNRNDWDVK